MAIASSRAFALAVEIIIGAGAASITTNSNTLTSGTLPTQSERAATPNISMTRPRMNRPKPSRPSLPARRVDGATAEGKALSAMASLLARWAD
jgi:hypothetical protein